MQGFILLLVAGLALADIQVYEREINDLFGAKGYQWLAMQDDTTTGIVMEVQQWSNQEPVDPMPRSWMDCQMSTLESLQDQIISAFFAPCENDADVFSGLAERRFFPAMQQVYEGYHQQSSDVIIVPQVYQPHQAVLVLNGGAPLWLYQDMEQGPFKPEQTSSLLQEQLSSERSQSLDKANQLGLDDMDTLYGLPYAEKDSTEEMELSYKDLMYFGNEQKQAIKASCQQPGCQQPPQERRGRHSKKSLYITGGMVSACLVVWLLCLREFCKTCVAVRKYKAGPSFEEQIQAKGGLRQPFLRDVESDMCDTQLIKAVVAAHYVPSAAAADELGYAPISNDGSSNY